MNKRVSLVVGGTGGIGLESAKCLLEKGNYVCIWGKENIEKTREKINTEKCEFLKTDLTNKKSIEEGVKKTLEKMDTIDSIIYSVSIPIRNKKIEETEWDEFQSHINIQIKSFLDLVKSVIQNVKEDKRIKFIVILTEYCVGKPPSNISPYVTAKYGLMGLVKSLASELDPNKYTFNMISPGMVETELISNLHPRFIEMTAQQNPMKRIAKPSDISGVISFLDSDASDYMNGTNTLVNGGGKFA